MNSLQKKAFRYEVLRYIAISLTRQADTIKDNISQYTDRLQDGCEIDWYQEQIETLQEKLKVIETIEKDLEKL